MSTPMSRSIGLLVRLIFFIVAVGCHTQICSNITRTDSSISIIESFRFDNGLSHRPDSSCSWILPSKTGGFYQVSLRTVEFDTHSKSVSHELIFRTNEIEYIYNEPRQRYWRFPALNPLQIEFRPKDFSKQSSNLNVSRFRLELVYDQNDGHQIDRCATTAYSLPVEWKCNCQYECMIPRDQMDISDEANCPLCSLVNSPEFLFCRPDEFWCLPGKSLSDTDDSVSGVCLKRFDERSCIFSTRSLKCDRTIAFMENSRQMVVTESMLTSEENLCLVLMPKERRQIQLIIQEVFDADVTIRDGDQMLNFPTYSGFIRFDPIFIHKNVVLISVRKKTRSTILFGNNHDRPLLNMSWSINFCPDNQMRCTGLQQNTCYTKEQRCDGVWDCINGDDELGCAPQSCPNKFSCNDRLRLPADIPRCYSLQERCNGFAYCINRMDERFCSAHLCNSQNGTFLCHNRNCIYEVWRCDGQDDCGDGSDERNCPAQVPRRIITSIIIGVTVCSTLFVVALACSCKLYHLRMLERRASIRFINPQTFIQQNTTPSNDVRQMAPPSYNQTMGYVDENEERYALLSENLRMAGLSDMITIVPMDSSHSRRSRRSRTRRARNAEASNNSGRLVRQFDLFRSLFSNSNDYLQSNEIEISEHGTAALRELPPDYVANPAVSNLPNSSFETTDSAIQTNDSSSTLSSQPKQRSGRLVTVNEDEGDDQPLQTNSDDDKLLIP